MRMTCIRHNIINGGESVTILDWFPKMAKLNDKSRQNKVESSWFQDYAMTSMPYANPLFYISIDNPGTI